jgi:hypothetical protein
MARTATETASILSNLYEEQFSNESFEPFRITWPQLRFLAEVPLLTDHYLKEVNKVLSETDHSLIPFNHFLVIVMDQDMKDFRRLPDRLLEKCLYEIEDIELGDHESCDDDKTKGADGND